ncbi:MAG TPA: hypothetical protein VGC42_16210 [Kofleriaceae bacterium]
MVELDTGGCDIAVRYARLAADDRDALYRERMIVVYSPALHAADAPLPKLLRYPPLYDDTPEPWLRLLVDHHLLARRRDLSRGYIHARLVVQAAVRPRRRPRALRHRRRRSRGWPPLSRARPAGRLMVSPHQRGSPRSSGSPPRCAPSRPSH